MHADLTAAMKAGDRIAVRVLRTALAAIANAEAPPVAEVAGAPVIGRLVEHGRLVLTAHDIARVLQAEVDDRIETIAQFERGGRHDAADELRTELAVLRPYVAVSRDACASDVPAEMAEGARSPRPVRDQPGSSGGSPSSVSKPGSG